MTTKLCTNHKCPAYAHFVYTLAMRCNFCRWDLKAAQRGSVAEGADGGRKHVPSAESKSDHLSL